MERRYGKLSLEGRWSIASLHAQGALNPANRSRSGSRVEELKRNAGRQVGYKPAYAQEQASARRWKGSRLERDAAPRDTVLACLRKGWSPEQTMGGSRVRTAG